VLALKWRKGIGIVVLCNNFLIDFSVGGVSGDKN